MRLPPQRGQKPRAEWAWDSGFVFELRADFSPVSRDGEWYRAIRGGSWKVGVDEEPLDSRGSLPADLRGNYLAFGLPELCQGQHPSKHQRSTTPEASHRTPHRRARVSAGVRASRPARASRVRTGSSRLTVPPAPVLMRL